MDDHPKKKGFFSAFRGKFAKKKSDEEVADEIKDMVLESHEAGVIEENAAEMINNIIDLGEKTAADVMVHRKNITAFDGSLLLEEIFNLMLETGFSRYPVYEKDLDNIVGVFHIRDVVKAYSNEENRGKKILDLRDEIFLTSYTIPETRMVSKLFQDMRKKKVHMAIVIDEYGQTAGLVTMEDVLEEIVGNIWDEHDEPCQNIIVRSDGSVLAVGEAELEELEDVLGITFDDESTTVNGFMTNKLGHIPADGEEFSFEYKGYEFKILKAKDRVVRETLIKKVSDIDS